MWGTLMGRVVADGRAAIRSISTRVFFTSSPEVPTVVRDLLVAHYDPIYRQSLRRNFPLVEAEDAERLEWDGGEASLAAAARRAIGIDG